MSVMTLANCMRMKSAVNKMFLTYDGMIRDIRKIYKIETAYLLSWGEARMYKEEFDFHIRELEDSLILRVERGEGKYLC